MADKDYKISTNSYGGEIVSYLDDTYVFLHKLILNVEEMTYLNDDIQIKDKKNNTYTITFNGKNQITKVTTSLADPNNGEDITINLGYDRNGNVNSISYKSTNKST